ncbi:MAG: SBBP repeat-containing protein [Marinilabiliales bacterium]
MHRIDVTFSRYNESTRTYSLEEQKEYLNYFLPQCPDGITHLHGNQYLITPDLYENIDLLYSSNQNGIKYYFIVKPGGDPSSICMNYEGADSTAVDATSGDLTIYSSIGKLIYDQPTAYQLDCNNDIVEINGWDAEWDEDSQDTYKFTLGSYNTSLPLIIQVDRGNGTRNPSQNMLWSTYYGAGGDDFNDITTDNSGNVIVTGNTYSSNFPVSSGPYQGNNAGDEDAVIVKFNYDYSRLWATYFGGSDIEESYSVITDPYKNIYLTGQTKSSDFPNHQLSGAYYDDINTGIYHTDIFIIRINQNGDANQLWATYYGGTGLEIGKEINIDNSGNIYVVGLGDSNTPLYTSGTYNSTSGGGLIIKFNSSGAQQWASLLEGSGCINSIDFDNSNNAYITGYSAGSGLPIVNPGANSTFSGGSWDAFVTKFTASTNAIDWSTYYGGSGNDVSYSIAVSPLNNNVFVTGYTDTDDNSLMTEDPGSGAYYEEDNKGDFDLFITEFNSSGVLQWATLYGGSNNDEGNDIIVDNNGSVYLTGYTYSSDIEIPSPNYDDGYTQNLTGTGDAFILGFTSGRIFTWGTYFGGNDKESGKALSVYQDNLFLTGSTVSSSSFPLEPGNGIPYYDDSNSSGYMVGFVSVFDMSTFLGISEYSNENVNINIYPNPATDNINIEFEIKEKSQINIRISDIKDEESYFNIFYLIAFKHCAGIRTKLGNIWRRCITIY